MTFLFFLYNYDRCIRCDWLLWNLTLCYRIPRTIGVSIPMKATFFITYIMVDGWAGIASEILRLKPLVIFHLKNMFLVKTERDREKAMNPGSVDFPETLPSLQLYFLLGLVYAVVTPILLPFILVFFAFAYLVYRHQVSFSTILAFCLLFPICLTTFITILNWIIITMQLSKIAKTINWA